MVKKTKKAFAKMGTTVIGLATMDNLTKAVKSEVGQEVAKKLYGHIFNIGPSDEAILDNAISEISKNPQVRARIRMRFNEFFADMRKNDWSVEWFKAVMVKKNRDWKLGSKDKSPAAKTLSAIDQGVDFEEKVKIATSELMHKTIKSKVKDGWHAVMSDDGEIKILVDAQKVKKAFSATGNFVGKKIEAAKEDFKSGFKSSSWSVSIFFGVLAVIFLILIWIY